MNGFYYKRKTLYLLLFTLLAGCVASRDAQQKEIRQLYKRAEKEDTTYVYSLPYEQGASSLIVQGYYSAFTHKNRIAVDFKMKEGTKITAARDGVVVRTEEKNNKGGGNRKYRKYANYLVVEHEDGSRAGYWHLQQNGVLVNIGDTVRQGQVIALSGKTGYSFLPHLHFLVWNSNGGQWQQLPTRFETRKGPRYLKPFKRYKKP